MPVLIELLTGMLGQPPSVLLLLAVAGAFMVGGLVKACWALACR